MLSSFRLSFDGVRSFGALVAFTCLAMCGRAFAEEARLAPGQHLCLVGNTLPDRAQHTGWLETAVYLSHADADLVIRNLGFSADELSISLRSAGFGSQDEHLTRCAADVVWAFYGYNESYAGEVGLEKYKQDLRGFVQRLRSQQYNGQSAPQVVLFGPQAHEDLQSPHLPDGVENNARLALYSQATADVAAELGVPFVDLYAITSELYAEQSAPLTINGVHFNDLGDRLIAGAVAEQLFPSGGAPVLPADLNQLDTAARSRLDAVRAAVLQKAFYWHQRYRIVDGYSIFGGRADLQFVEGQTNRVVMQRELEILEQMTANRDRPIWAALHGSEQPPTDDNLSAFIPVVSNKPGAGPNGEHLFLSGFDAVSQMKLGAGFQVQLYAAEDQFPDLINPVQMSFDTRGRLWVATWPTYPHWKPTEPMNDKLLILLDDDGDGKADRTHCFADGLHCPTGFEFWNGGVLVAQAPDLMFLQDTDGDDVADVRTRVVSGLDSADTHHTANSFVFDPGGGLYFQEGVFHQTQVETPFGPPQRCSDAGVYRYEPRSQRFEVYVSFGFANPHGHAFDRWGRDIVVDGTGANPFDAALFSGHVDYPHKHNRPPQVYQQRTRPCPGIEYVSGGHFPPEMDGDLLVANVIGFQGILRYRIDERDSSLAGTELEPVLYSDDPNFRPADLEIGPEGALYFIDWQNPIIGHMQHNLRDPSRDRKHGRVYRVTYADRPLATPATIDGAPLAALLELLKSPQARVRYRARIELTEHAPEAVVAALPAWLAALPSDDPQLAHHQLEALWLQQSCDFVNEELLERVLTSPEPRARAASVRVLCAWRERVSDPLAKLQRAVNDENPRVRLEAVRALSFFRGADAVAAQEILAESLLYPDDEYLRFLYKETADALARQAQ